jgi:hypothetical protein
MSQEYLQQRLFTPFAQEDQLAPGTGLGLSIVRQIVSSLGGKIAVTSLKDVGTNIRVSVTMTQDPQPTPILNDVYDVSSVSRKTKDLDVFICGLEAKANTEINNENSKPSEVGAWLHGANGLGSSIEGMCRDWFGMRVHNDMNEKLNYDLYIIGENDQNLADLKSGAFFNKLKENTTQKEVSKEARLIVLCKTNTSAGILKASLGQIEAEKGVIIISQPCGPQKLARALWRCIERQPGSISEQGSTMAASKSPIIAGHPRESHPNNPQIENLVVSLQKQPSADLIPINILSSVAPTPIIEDVQRVETKPSIQPTGSAEHGTGPFLLVDDNHINLRVRIEWFYFRSSC